MMSDINCVEGGTPTMKCAFHRPLLGLSNAASTIQSDFWFGTWGDRKVSPSEISDPKSTHRHFSRISKLLHKTSIKTCSDFRRTPRMCATASTTHKLSNDVSTTLFGQIFHSTGKSENYFSPQIFAIFDCFEANISEKCKSWAKYEAKDIFQISRQTKLFVQMMSLAHH